MFKTVLPMLDFSEDQENQKGKEVPNIVPEEQALQMSFVSLMHQESIAKVHNDAQRNAFEEEKRRIALEKGKEISFFDARQHYLPSSDLNLPHTSGMDTFTDDDHMRNLSDSDDDVSKRGSTPTRRFHKNHPQSQLLQKSTAGFLTRRRNLKKVLLPNIKHWRGAIDKTLFIKKDRRDIMLVQVYVDDIIFGSTKSSITIKPASTPIEAHKSLGKDEEGEDVDVHLYRFQVHSKDNESTICIVKNPVLHSKTKHIQIRHHFIRDCYEQRLINVVKVHTDDNVADLLTKGFDLARFNFLVRNHSADLLFDDTDGLTVFQSNPQWKYLVHVLLHCLSPKSTSWEQFRTNIASALQLEGVTRPQNFLPSVTLPSKVFTFMRKNSPKFSGRITPLTPPMLEVITTLAAEEAHSESTHSRAESSPRDAQGTPTQSAAQASILQGTADFQGTAEAQGAADIPQSPNDYTPTDDKGKLKKLSKGVKPLVKHHILWVKSQKLKKRGKKQNKKVSSVTLGRNKDEDAVVAVTPDLERKSDKTEHVIIEEEKDTSDVKSPSSPIRPTQEEEPEEQFKDDEFLADIPTQYHQKEEINSSNKIRALETDMDRKGARKGSSRIGCRRREKKVGRFEETKTKDYFEETYISYTRTESNDELLKGSRIQEFTKTKVQKKKSNVIERMQETLKEEKSYSYRRTAIQEA
ncbi:hypothetical protein Tco_1369430 [Tanacetum coccineum]